MQRTRDSLIWGVVLLIAGVVLLLWNFDVFAAFAETAQLILAGVFALLGLAFLISYLLARSDWWKVIPGFALLAVGGIIFLGLRQVAPAWIGGMLFIGLALAFAVIYFGDRQERWWALIPFGVMLVMVAIILLGSLGLGEAALGAVLFGGMGAVFLLVYVLATDRSRFRWALIPAIVLLVMGLVVAATAVTQTNPEGRPVIRLWPILLVIAGVALIGFALNRPGAKPAPAQLPEQPSPAEVSAVGTSAMEVAEEAPGLERAPILLYESPVAASPAPPAPASTAAGPAASLTQTGNEAAGAPGNSSINA